MRPVKIQLTMRGNQVFKCLHPPSVTIIRFLNTMD